MEIIYKKNIPGYAVARNENIEIGQSFGFFIYLVSHSSLKKNNWKPKLTQIMLQLQGGGVAGQRPQQGEGCSAPAQGRKRSPTRIHTSARLPQARREQVTSNYLLTVPGLTGYIRFVI